MKAEIKQLMGIDVGDLLLYRPTDPSNFSIAVRLIAGPQNAPGEESFDFEVCTPDWLKAASQPGVIRNLRHTVLVDAYDATRLLDFIRTYVSSCSGKDWNEVAEKLSRLGHWEFEDYQST